MATEFEKITWINGNVSEKNIKDGYPYYVLNNSGKPLDTAIMTNDEFAAIRPGRIGGSSVATLLGISPWNCITEYYNQFIEVEPVIKTEFNAAAKQAGHDAEEFVAQRFVTYMKRRENTDFEIINDSRVFRNNKYPYAQVNLDRRIVKVNGKPCDAILECKTTNMRNLHTINEYWKKGICPPYYECQVRYYMMVMNVKVAYICCCWGLQEDEMAVIKIERNDELDKPIINACEAFIDCVEQGMIPDEVNPNSELYNNAWLRYNGAPAQDVPPVEFPPNVLPIVQKAIELEKRIEEDEAKLAADKAAQQDVLKALLPLYNGADYGSVAEDDEDTGMRTIYGVALKPHYKRAKFDEEKFKADHADLWTKYQKSSLDLTALGRAEKKIKAEYTLPAEVDGEKGIDLKITTKQIPIPAEN